MGAPAFRDRRAPDSWPPDLSAEDPLPLLDRAYAALTGEFAGHATTDPAFTWHEPDQTVGFWVRRMAQGDGHPPRRRGTGVGPPGAGGYGWGIVAGHGAAQRR